jgi:hypothetical protein
MYNLLYPAVLGSMFYALLPPLGDIINHLAWNRLVEEPKLLLGILVVAHYAIDYLCAQKFRPYGRRAFLLDLAVIFSLFLAFNAIDLPANILVADKETVNVPLIAKYLTSSYGLFILWALLLWKELPRRGIVLAVETLGLLWFGFVWLKEAPVLALTVGLILLTVAMGWLGVTLRKAEPARS